MTDDQELRDVDHRLRLCGECPKKGGRCDQPDQTTIDPGQEPYWENRFRWRTCDKWPTYNLRKRLASFGLHGDLSAKQFTTYELGNTTNAAAIEDCRGFVEAWGNEDMDSACCGLLLLGAPGVGKTHLAAAVVRALVIRKKIRAAWFVYVSNFLTEMRLKMKDNDAQLALIERSKSTPLLVWDDLGAHSTTPWVRENLALVINHRYVERLPMIITTNDSLDSLRPTLGERTVSRLYEMLEQVPLAGEDHRRNA